MESGKVMQDRNAELESTPLSAKLARGKPRLYDNLRKILCGIFGVILLSVIVYSIAKGGTFIRDTVSDSRQTSVLHEFNLYLWAESDFMLPINDKPESVTNEIHRNHLATTSPEVIKQAMKRFAERSGCREELTGNPDFPIEALIPKRLGVFMVGPYLYIYTDNEGNQIHLGPSDELRALLVDTRPLSDGQYLFAASDGSMGKTGNQTIDQNGIIHQK